MRATRALLDISPIRVRGRFGCLCRPVQGADWLDVRPVDGGPVGTDVWIKYIGDSFSRYQSSDAAPLTEVQDIYIILHINTECFAGLYSTRIVSFAVRITRSLEEVIRCGGVLSLCQTMDGAALADDRSGITFTADLCVPWDAPEAVVDMNSPDLISLGPFPDKVGLVGRRKEAAMSRIMKGRDCRSVRFVVPDVRLVDRGFHDVTVVDMEDDREPTIVLQDMTRLRELWPVEVFDHMKSRQQDLELMQKSVGNSSFVPDSAVDTSLDGGFLQLLREPREPLTVTPPVSPMVADTSTPTEGPDSQRETMPIPSISPVLPTGEVHADPGPDLSREGPFNACDVVPDAGQSPVVMDSMTGCQYRMTSYEERVTDSDMNPSYGIHMHDPRVIEYMGAPESARLMGRTPEYWLQHMGRERTIQAALRLHHDASLIMTNIQIMSQLATSFSRAASEVMRTIHNREPFPTEAVDLVTPGRQVRRAAHYMAAMGLWRPTSAPVFPGPVSASSCNSCMACDDCFPDGGK